MNKRPRNSTAPSETIPGAPEVPEPLTEEDDPLREYRALVDALAQTREKLLATREEHGLLTGERDGLIAERRTYLQSLIHRDASVDPLAVEQRIARLDLRREVVEGQRELLEEAIFVAENDLQAELLHVHEALTLLWRSLRDFVRASVRGTITELVSEDFVQVQFAAIESVVVISKAFRSVCDLEPFLVHGADNPLFDTPALKWSEQRVTTIAAVVAAAESLQGIAQKTFEGVRAARGFKVPAIVAPSDIGSDASSALPVPAAVDVHDLIDYSRPIVTVNVPS